jgi:hypothetical protein
MSGSTARRPVAGVRSALILGAVCLGLGCDRSGLPDDGVSASANAGTDAATGALGSTSGDSSAGPDARLGPGAASTCPASSRESCGRSPVPCPTLAPCDAEAAPTPSATPITGLTAGVWTWVPFPQALCRDGSPTGIGVNLGTSDHLMIFLEGGGACFDPATCAGNPSSFGETAFGLRVASTLDEIGVNTGILDRTNGANPVRDWSFVYVPYCTGDLHAGNNVATVPPFPPQHFVGYTNVGLYLDRIVPTFPNAQQVLLTGLSAGGFGAAFNYAHVAKAFGSTPVTLLDDSGPFMQDPYFATCLQNNLRSLWGLDGTVLPDCGSDCATPSSFFLDSMKHAAKAYPKVAFGLADSTDDVTITLFYGWGTNTCTGTTPLSGATFTAGLSDIRTQLAPPSNFGAFLFAGINHTTIQSAAFYTRTSGGQGGGAGTSMTDWVTGLLGGAATNAGP